MEFWRGLALRDDVTCNQVSEATFAPLGLVKVTPIPGDLMGENTSGHVLLRQKKSYKRQLVDGGEAMSVARYTRKWRLSIQQGQN